MLSNLINWFRCHDQVTYIPPRPPVVLRPQIAELVAHIRDWQHGWVVDHKYEYGRVYARWTWYDVTVSVERGLYGTLYVYLVSPSGEAVLTDSEKLAVVDAFNARDKYNQEKRSNQQLEELSRRLNRDVAISP